MSKILTGNLIGFFAKVIDSKNKSLMGVEGKIIKETQNTVTIKTEYKPKILIKNQIKLKIENGN